MSRFRSANDNHGVAGPERRSNHRQRTLLAGKLVFPHNSFGVDCTIRNISSGGAQICVSMEGLSPEPFLIVIKRGILHESRTVWQAGLKMGLEFIRTIDLGEPVPLQFRRLQRLWIDLAPR